MFGYRWFALSKSVQWLEISLKLNRNNLAFHNFIRLTFNSTNCDLKIKKRSFFEVYQNIEVSLPTAQHWTNIKSDLRLNTHSNSFAIISWEGEKKTTTLIWTLSSTKIGITSNNKCKWVKCLINCCRLNHYYFSQAFYSLFSSLYHDFMRV